MQTRDPDAAPPFGPGAVVVITGASSGNGRAAALEFAAAGASLVLCGRRQHLLDEVAEACRALGGDAVARVADVGDEAQVQALADEALRRWGALDVWINNASVLQYGRFEETPAEVVEQLVRTNLVGCFNGSRTALRHFRRQGRGVLINTTSVLGVVGHPFTAAYVATKFAIRGFTQSLRQELQDAPAIHVCAVLPAAIDTPIYRRAANYLGHAIQPIRPIYPPRTVARAMLDLARRPRRQRYAGGFATLVALGAAIAPGLTERLIRPAYQLMERRGDALAPTPGNVLAPVSDGYRSNGGWRRRYGPSADSRVMLGALALVGFGLLAAAGRLRRR